MKNMFVLTKAQAQGTRPTQEDRIKVLHDTDGSMLLAAFDGHGGDTAAEKAANSLEVAYYANTTPFLLVSPTPVVLLDAIILELVRVTAGHTDGSTASIVYIPPSQEEAYVAILGDSPVFITDKDGNLWVSPEHNVRTNQNELMSAILKGAVAQNGYIYNPANGRGLQMSRALGDLDLNSILYRFPEIFRVELGMHSAILVGTDGILDATHMNSQAQYARIREMMETKDATTIVDDAVNRQTNDNASAILLQLTGMEPYRTPYGTNIVEAHAV